MLKYLMTGIVLGLSAGISPGPLLTLVLSETIKHGTKSGIRVAMAPLLTDLPIVLLCYFGISRLDNSNTLLGFISIIGAFYIVYLGIQSLKTSDIQYQTNKMTSQSLLKGVVANFSNPHPYLFWLTVGIPIIFNASQVNNTAVIGFLFGFYLFIVSSKVIIAILTGRSKQSFSNNIFVYINRFLGIVLIIFSILLFYDGYKLLVVQQ